MNKNFVITKKIIQRLDVRFLDSRLTDWRTLRSTTRRFLNRDTNIHSNSFHINYISKERELARLCHKFGTDKGEAAQTFGEHTLKRTVHNYSEFYDFLFSNCRQTIGRVFECGIGTNNEFLASSMGKRGVPGASLRVWREYFPNAQIVGADIDENCIFEEPRISTYQVDQTNPESIKNMWADIGGGAFDLIIDDGLHTFVGGKVLFENSIACLAENGHYIIEDVNPWDIREFEKYFHNSPHLVYFVHLLRKGNSLGDNSLIVIQKITN